MSKLNLGSILEMQAHRYQEKVLMVCGDERISYRTMNNRVNCLANGLISLGVGKGEKVAALLHNGSEAVETFFAVVKAGAVYVPLNYRLTGEELTYIVEDSEARTLVFGGGVREVVQVMSRFLGRVSHYIMAGHEPDSGFMSYADIIRRSRSGEPAGRTTLQDESTILYTSGTTGRPKGVILTHGNQFFNSVNYACAYGMVDQDRELALTPMFHSSTLGRIVTYIFTGSTFVTAKRFDPLQALETIEREKITSITQAPTMYAAMMNLKDAALFDTSSVRRVVTGAAPMSSGTKRALRELFPRAGFFDLYGITEAAPGVTILKPDHFLAKIESVGKPMATVEVKVVDDEGKVLPRGEVGEVICRGPNVMKGYYKDREATAETLRDGWLFTGDLGRLDEDGFLYLAGRKKDLIISGGENIYPAEIERVLQDHPQIQEAAVVGVPDPYWGERVKAFVVVKPGETLSPEEVIRFCEERLAGYKKAKEVVFLDGLPRNAANKVVKEKLKK